MVVLAQSVRASVCGTEGRGFEPHIPPKRRKQPPEAAFSIKGHNGDTLFKAVKRMQPPSEPLINRENPKKYFIYWNHDVPYPLWNKYKRKRVRIKVYDNVNRYKEQEREEYAELRRQVWKYNLQVLNYNPFEEEMLELQQIRVETKEVIQQIQEQQVISIEDSRKQTKLYDALELYIESRKARTKNTNSISSHKGTVKWIKEYFTSIKQQDILASEVTRLQIASALTYMQELRSWSNTTLNKELNFCSTAFNWLAREDYIIKNPFTGKIEKQKTKKVAHKWYDRETAATIKKALISADQLPVYRACQFTYFLCVRSQAELLKLKVSDIDRTLKRVRYREDVSKNGNEEYRDYPDAFDEVLDSLEFDSLPQHYYLFGKAGVPHEIRAGKNTLAALFKPVRDRIGLSPNYTIYGWKHTRVIHEMMKGTDAYEIQFMCRHGDLKETQNYMRGFDLSLRKIYEPQDLTF
jgi:site-specific recombinase XerD